MKNLLELAMQETEKNISKKRSSRKSINDALFELLYKKEAKTKLRLVGEISLERLQNELDIEIDEKSFKTDKVKKEFERINKTVSNGFDTAVCAGKTNSSFNSNKVYRDKYELIKNINGTYTIIDKK
jgi:hypothetical protein